MDRQAGSQGRADIGNDPLPRRDKRGALAAMVERWARYDASTLDMTIDRSDDMYMEATADLAHYGNVGLSALHLVADAMLLAGRSECRSVLDLPCGGGRVTRHLKAFFPEAAISVGDIDGAKLAFVSRQFGATPLPFRPDFTGSPGRCFDLIFVGSLLTHFDRDLFGRALAWFVEALEPGGLLVATTHGRYSIAAAKPNRILGTAWRRWRLARTGFAYREVRSYSDTYGQSYGVSLTAPFWIMRLAERHRGIRILGFNERGFADNQDVLTLQKLG